MRQSNRRKTRAHPFHIGSIFWPQNNFLYSIFGWIGNQRCYEWPNRLVISKIFNIWQRGFVTVPNETPFTLFMEMNRFSLIYLEVQWG